MLGFKEFVQGIYEDKTGLNSHDLYEFLDELNINTYDTLNDYLDDTVFDVEYFHRIDGKYNDCAVLKEYDILDFPQFKLYDFSLVINGIKYKLVNFKKDEIAFIQEGFETRFYILFFDHKIEDEGHSIKWYNSIFVRDIQQAVNIISGSNKVLVIRHSEAFCQ